MATRITPPRPHCLVFAAAELSARHNRFFSSPVPTDGAGRVGVCAEPVKPSPKIKRAGGNAWLAVRQGYAVVCPDGDSVPAGAQLRRRNWLPLTPPLTKWEVQRPRSSYSTLRRTRAT